MPDAIAAAAAARDAGATSAAMNETVTDAVMAQSDGVQAEPHETTVAESAPLLSGPVDVRSAALVLLAVMAGLYVLNWASDVFVPLLLGVMFSYALKPVVNRLVALHVPRTLAAALLLVGIVGGVGAIGYGLRDDAAAMIETLPAVAQKLRQGLERQSRQGPPGAIETVQKAASELELAAENGTRASPPPARGVTKVQIEKPRFDIKNYLWPGALGLVGAVGQALVVLFITFFLLASGDTFRRKMVKLAGPSFGEKKLTLQALDEVDEQIQRYLLVQVLTSSLVGVATWLAFAWIGVDHAGVWGVVSFVLNFIPYFGSMVVTGGSAVLGFVQFGSFEMALLIGGVTLFINSIEGYILTPWLTGKASRMNPVAIFVGVLAWGWLWGAWGLVLGVPILMAIKAVCDRVEDLRPVGELLGD